MIEANSFERAEAVFRAACPLHEAVRELPAGPKSEKRGFSIRPACGILRAMKLRAVMRWFLVLGIAVGVVIGPAAPLMAAMPSASTSSMTSAAADEDAMQMADDMPCCPDQTKSKGCDSCPLVALCVLAISLPAPSGDGVLIERHPLRTAFATDNDLLIDGLGAKPPDHPPRTIL